MSQNSGRCFVGNFKKRRRKAEELRKEELDFSKNCTY